MKKQTLIGFSLISITLISVGIFMFSNGLDESVQAIESQPATYKSEEKLLSTTNNEDTINIQEEMSYIRKKNIELENAYIENLEEKIKTYLGDDISNVGLVFYDLVSNKKIAINENNFFTAASTYKVGMNMVAYEMVDAGELSLDDGLKYTSSCYEEGTGILQGQIDTTLQSPIPLQKLLDYSIIYSDNIATNMVSSKLGGFTKVRQAVNSIANVSNENLSSNVITPETEFRLLKILYSNRFNENYAHLIEVLKSTEFHDRIDKYLPYDIVAHKIGNYGSFVNDVGIVFGDNPYILVVYTDGVANAADKIANLSKMVYTAQLEK